MKGAGSLLATLGMAAALTSSAVAGGESLLFPAWRASDIGEVRGMTAQPLSDRLKLSVEAASPSPTETKRPGYAWAVLPAPGGKWDLGRRAAVEAEIANRGSGTLNVMLWVVGDRGWDAVPDVAKLAPGETRRFSCDLRAAFPDGTPKIDPSRVKQVQVMVSGRITHPAILEVRNLRATGEAAEWVRPAARIEVPPVEEVPPVAGKRVRYRLASDKGTGIYGVLHLPQDWKAGGKYPVIVEYPGNIFFVPGCYSTGLPDQCVIGYGISKGVGVICVSLPFVDRGAGVIAENGWGVADDTADYAVRMVEDICAKFGGDSENILLTGFSRGAIACGYIGLRNERIAALWKGFHACQHYDGDGWNGATMEGALERARRFRGKSVFQTDNSPVKFQPVMEAMKTQVTFVQSGLGAHATAMFLDDRPSTQQLRAWYWSLVGKPQPSN